MLIWVHFTRLSVGALAALHTVRRDWKTMLNADPVHGRRVLRDLRIETT